DQRRLADDEDRGSRVERAQMTSQDQRGADDLVGRGRNPQARELRRVVAARLQGLVREERDAATSRAQRRDPRRRAGDQDGAPIDRPVEIEEPRSLREPERGDRGRPQRSSGATATWARSTNGAGISPRSTTPMTAMARASPPANDGATDADCASGSC